jgi:hypothetical protein
MNNYEKRNNLKDSQIRKLERLLTAENAKN